MPIPKQKTVVPQNKSNSSFKVNWGNILIASISVFLSVLATFLAAYRTVPDEVNIILGIILVISIMTATLSLFRVLEK